MQAYNIIPFDTKTSSNNLMYMPNPQTLTKITSLPEKSSVAASKNENKIGRVSFAVCEFKDTSFEFGTHECYIG